MKLAIISDIHGNIHALDAVLADLARQRPDEVIVNGDLVNRGPNSIEVLERLAPLGYPTTLGNHDDLMLKWERHDPDIPDEWYSDPFWKGTEWTVDQLVGAGWLEALRGLPMTHRVELPGAPVLLISHGSPRHYREGYGSFLADESLSEIAQHYPADILIGSHTHRPFERRWGSHLFLNTGAVGAPFNGDPRAQYLLLTLEGGEWRWSFRAVPYDREAAIAAFEAAGLIPDGELSAFIFREELRYAIPLHAPFWMWAEKQGRAMDWPAWHDFRAAYRDRLVPPRPAAPQ